MTPAGTKLDMAASTGLDLTYEQKLRIEALRAAARVVAGVSSSPEILQAYITAAIQEHGDVQFDALVLDDCLSFQLVQL